MGSPAPTALGAVVPRIAARRMAIYSLLAIAVIIPRLAVLLVQRGAILADYTYGEKSDDIARIFVDTGTFGFIPGYPTAYTQPLYSFFLIPIYESVGRSWLTVGGAQILVALATALVVYEIGRRWLSPSSGALAAVIVALNPYSMWHDVHVNREILDGVLAAGIVFLVLLLAEKRTLWLSAALGVLLGLAILGNVRLTLLPIALGALLLWRWRPSWGAIGAVATILAVCVLVVAPWVVRNRVQVGCFALTTDARALWEANNELTLGTLRKGLWIDNVPLPTSYPPSAQDAGRMYHRQGRIVGVDECAQASFYRSLVLDFWRDHPGEKVSLAGQATLMLWNPIVSPGETRDDRPSWLSTLQAATEPAYILPLYLLAIFGLTRVPRFFAALSVLLLGYQWVLAMIFVGATRYRVPWDFVVALLAAAAVIDLVSRARRSYARRRAALPMSA